jgi:hypothetical protein
MSKKEEKQDFVMIQSHAIFKSLVLVAAGDRIEIFKPMVEK